MSSLHLKLLAGALAIAVGVQLLPYRVACRHRPVVSLSALLPVAPKGWREMDLPIASTVEMQWAVNELLHYDDAVFRRYQNRDEELEVYVAYWEPGRMDPRLVAAHNPDVCWQSVGWVLVIPTGGRSFASAESGLGSGHYREFTHGAESVNVIFWHLVGGKPSPFLEDGRPWWNFRTIVMNPFARQQDQVFIRISSHGSLFSPAIKPMLEAVIRSLAPFRRSPNDV